jgi:hypothetical protein
VSHLVQIYLAHHLFFGPFAVILVYHDLSTNCQRAAAGRSQLGKRKGVATFKRRTDHAMSREHSDNTQETSVSNDDFSDGGDTSDFDLV